MGVERDNELPIAICISSFHPCSSVKGTFGILKKKAAVVVVVVVAKDKYCTIVINFPNKFCS